MLSEGSVSLHGSELGKHKGWSGKQDSLRSGVGLEKGGIHVFLE